MLQEGLKYTGKGRICITQNMHNQLSDFEYLKKDLDQQPTHLSELVPDHPVAVGPHDASGHGMGGACVVAHRDKLQPHTHPLAVKISGRNH